MGRSAQAGGRDDRASAAHTAAVPTLITRLQAIDTSVTRWMARYGPVLLRLSLGLVFLWFGALKLIPGISPAQDLAHLRAVLFLLYAQMLGTLTPIVLFPHEVFLQVPFIPTLEGQYIIKNLVLISAGIVIGATVRGGRIVAEPQGK